jgi:hypothetical protein
MGSSETPQSSGGTAIWFFVCATFLFSGSTFFGTSGDHRDAIAIVGIVAGFVVLAAGIVVFGREMKGNRG